MSEKDVLKGCPTLDLKHLAQRQEFNLDRLAQGLSPDPVELGGPTEWNGGLEQAG